MQHLNLKPLYLNIQNQNFNFAFSIITINFETFLFKKNIKEIHEIEIQ
ncbi:hypothetical protein LMANV2_10020 [Leptospira interrogans serovar Manilae]|uniref:Uncharacterized protein n=1 Tax=Leptospira interrogans serovar Manilae TaxID=214675 RepID=A0AAQ1NX51_LEPIR|nr:hypothetical protein LMANV2_10020 [Leptospira interrogans serovar Manilae]